MNIRNPAPGTDLTRALAALPGSTEGSTLADTVTIGDITVPRFTSEFWTSRQRQASSIHEVSYRACFKPQLPRFFIDLLTTPGDLVYDPFSGRGTTVIEAGLAGRRVAANDVNPLSMIMTAPRFFPPDPGDVAVRLKEIPRNGGQADTDLSMFYHPETEQEIVGLREYLAGRKKDGELDPVDRWIAMVATNRLTGHSSGFFSVYTLPPNQAVSPESQKRINRKRSQVPDYRDTHGIIEKKTRSLIRSVSSPDKLNLNHAGEHALLFTGDARRTRKIPDACVHLTVTSPPFLDIVQYREDNWLRCWFNSISADRIGKGITMARTVCDWNRVMGAVFAELYRITRPGGYVAFEVGEVRKRTIRLDEQVVPLGTGAGFSCEGVLINQQEFTKTSNIWGVDNNTCGTNTNRIVLFRKPGTGKKPK